MKKDNIITFRVFGRKALFTDAKSKIGGEKTSCLIPTYEALRRITDNIYWKPTIKWRILRCRVVLPIQTRAEGAKPLMMSTGEHTLSYYTYLRDVCYEVEAKMEWNEARADLILDRNEGKHFNMAIRALKEGGRLPVYLGTSECHAYVEPCVFGQEKGFYDGQNKDWRFGHQFHSFVYPDEAVRPEEKGKMTTLLWEPKMKHGEIVFLPQEECVIRRPIKRMHAKKFRKGSNYNGRED